MILEGTEPTGARQAAGSGDTPLSERMEAERKKNLDSTQTSELRGELRVAMAGFEGLKGLHSPGLTFTTQTF